MKRIGTERDISDNVEELAVSHPECISRRTAIKMWGVSHRLRGLAGLVQDKSSGGIEWRKSEREMKQEKQMAGGLT